MDFDHLETILSLYSRGGSHRSRVSPASSLSWGFRLSLAFDSPGTGSQAEIPSERKCSLPEAYVVSTHAARSGYGTAPESTPAVLQLVDHEVVRCSITTFVGREADLADSLQTLVVLSD